jgi:L-aminopeptidase/D-esterase-like protein
VGRGWLNRLFAAAYEAALEAVYNCLVAARPATRLDGSEEDGFPIDAIRR